MGKLPYMVRGADMTSCSAVDEGNCQGSGAQSPQVFLGLGLLLSGCVVTRPQGLLYICRHILTLPICNSCPPILQENIPQVYPQTFGKHLTISLHFTILIMKQTRKIILGQHITGFYEFNLFLLHMLFHLR